MMKTILFVHASDELYGSDRCLLAIVKGLPASYRAVVVLPTDVPHPGPLTRELCAAGATVLHRRMLVLRRANLRPRAIPGSIVSFIAGIRTLGRIAHDERATLVHSNTLAVVCSPFAAMLGRRPHLWHVHEFLGDEPKAIRTPLRLLMRLLPGTVVANSRATARSTGVADVRVIENGVFLPVRERVPVEKPTIGVVGRLSPRKGIAEALQAAAILKRDGHDFGLLIAGGPPPGRGLLRTEYERLAEQLSVAAITTFTGEVPDPAALYAGIDILLVPSQRPEPFGLTIIEGMAAGCAVVATRNGGGSDEILEDGVSGIYCEPDPESIAEALRGLLAAPDMRERIAGRAQEVARERYSAERYVAEMLQTYRELGA